MIQREALAWLTEDGIAQAVDVRLARASVTRLDLTVILTIDGEQRELQFDDVLGVINAV
ncbi:hypothetical protein GCM10009125_28820 [Castellaniella daejeonensis]|uniref:Uncharacterized protein n=1 Tax=Castellaniella daejeonensis TaxID=659013 RepID=A0ABN0U4E0_9BURK